MHTAIQRYNCLSSAHHTTHTSSCPKKKKPNGSTNNKLLCVSDSTSAGSYDGSSSTPPAAAAEELTGQQQQQQQTRMMGSFSAGSSLSSVIAEGEAAIKKALKGGQVRGSQCLGWAGCNACVDRVCMCCAAVSAAARPLHPPGSLSPCTC